MAEGAAGRDGMPRGEPPGMFRVLLRAALVLAVGFCVGMLLTAPIVGWPHAFPGLLMNAPEPLREIAGLAIIGITPLVALRALWGRIKR